MERIRTRYSQPGVESLGIIAADGDEARTVAHFAIVQSQVSPFTNELVTILHFYTEAKGFAEKSAGIRN